MKQLTMNNILNVVKQLKEKGFTDKEIKNMPIYLGNDEELNGIHTAWYCQLVDSKDEDNEDLIEMIGDDYSNVEFKDRAILIS